MPAALFDHVRECSRRSTSISGKGKKRYVGASQTDSCSLIELAAGVGRGALSCCPLQTFRIFPGALNYQLLFAECELTVLTTDASRLVALQELSQPRVQLSTEFRASTQMQNCSPQASALAWIFFLHASACVAVSRYCQAFVKLPMSFWQVVEGAALATLVDRSSTMAQVYESLTPVVSCHIRMYLTITAM